jgi:uncharacterized protein
VTNSNNPLRLNIGYFYNKPIGYSRDIPIDFNQITIEDLTVEALKSQVRISRTREGLLLQVAATAKVRTGCSRCLEEFFLPVSTEFEELYQFPSRQREETDLILPMDGYLDLSPLYREGLILGLPIKRLCKPDCKGLCIECGANLNLTTCEHYQNEDADSEQVQDEETV